jgi:hypothetical protein
MPQLFLKISYANLEHREGLVEEMMATFDDDDDDDDDDYYYYYWGTR